MTFKECEQITKKSSDDLLSQLIYYQGEDLMSEILRLGIQSLMEPERDEHIGAGSRERAPAGKPNTTIQIIITVTL